MRRQADHGLTAGQDPVRSGDAFGLQFLVNRSHIGALSMETGNATGIVRMSIAVEHCVPLGD
jgi:hypothetical protein